MRRLWKLFAFLGKYGNQPISSVLGADYVPTMDDLRMLADGIAELMRDEADAQRRAARV